MATRRLHPSTYGPAAQAAPWASSQPAETDPDGGADPEPDPNEEAAQEGDTDPREPGPYSGTHLEPLTGAARWTRSGRDRSHLRVVPGTGSGADGGQPEGHRGGRPS